MVASDGHATKCPNTPSRDRRRDILHILSCPGKCPPLGSLIGAGPSSGRPGSDKLRTFDTLLTIAFRRSGLIGVDEYRVRTGRTPLEHEKDLGNQPVFGLRSDHKRMQKKPSRRE